jgi:hypothetical protein
VTTLIVCGELNKSAAMRPPLLASEDWYRPRSPACTSKADIFTGSVLETGVLSVTGAAAWANVDGAAMQVAKSAARITPSRILKPAGE